MLLALSGESIVKVSNDLYHFIDLYFTNAHFRDAFKNGYFYYDNYILRTKVITFHYTFIPVYNVELGLVYIGSHRIVYRQLKLVHIWRMFCIWRSLHGEGVYNG